MWNSKSSDGNLAQSDSSDWVQSSTAPVTEMPIVPAKAPTPSKLTNESMIGKSVVIKGEIISSEPLYVCGRVEGTISAPGHRVTIGSEGKVKADIDAREVVIMGEVCGNMCGAERVEIRKDGSLTGNIEAARISVEDGAFVLGVIDICPPAQAEKPEARVESISAAESEDAHEAAETLEVA